MKKQTILITGADGYVGSRLASSLVGDGSAKVHLWLRASDDSEFESKRVLVRQRMGLGSFDESAVTCSYGDLREAEPFAEVDPSDVDIIVHSAAVTRFNVERDVAQAVNVEGQRKLLQFGERCTRLNRYLLISSLYATGLHHGEVAECLSNDDAGFSNYYEQSKWQCESDLAASNLPWTIARCGTIVSDSHEGEVSQFNAVHNTLKLFYYGMLSLVPGHATTPLYFVCGDTVTKALRAILTDGQEDQIYHISPERSNTIQLSEFIQSAHSAFCNDESFRKRRILPPLYSDLESFLDLSESMISMGSGVMSQATASISPFARQLFVSKSISNSNMRALLGSEITYSPDLVSRMCAWLAQNRWGRAANAVA